ncbi:MAG: amidohydrolase family protein [Candidatus Binataceae bacterium]
MSKIIDADAHIVEPRKLWQEYTEPAFRERVPQIAKDADGIDRLKFEGRVAEKSIYAPAAMCIPGGLSRPELTRELSWDDLRPGSYDPHARVKDMDAEGIDAAFLYPSLGSGFASIRDVELAAAACRAYNNWMADFCRPYPDRLFSIAPIPLQDVGKGIAEMRRVVKAQGVKAVMVRPNPSNGRLLSDPAYDPFWTEAQELNCTIAVHSAISGDMPTAGFERYHDFFQRMIISHPLEQQMACMDLICGGVLDKYPRLRVAFLEAGGGWIPYWLSRLDEFHGKIGHMVPKAKIKPSEYFRRQCFCSCEPDDIAIKTAAVLGSDEFLMWASDYPHYDCTFPGAVAELREHCEPLPEGARHKIMGDNAARCYGLQ